MKKQFLFLLIFIPLSYLSNNNCYAQKKIEGYITYDNYINTPIIYTQLILKDILNNKVDSTYTDYFGHYTLFNIPDGIYNIELRIKYSWGGVDATDVLLISKFFVNKYKFYDDLKKKAADVNYDLKINSTDALYILRRIVQEIDSFKSGDWKIENNTIIVNGLDIIKNIKVICTGDVDGSYFPDFKCGNILFDSRDNKTYKTIKIANQCWMQENLNIGKRINGYTKQTNNGIIEKYCYHNSESDCNIYGGLYTWDEMMQYTTNNIQGICPIGWHISGNDEWIQMGYYLGINPSIPEEEVGWIGTDEGGKLKSTGTIEEGNGLWHTPNKGATNSSGFSALPGGTFNDFFYEEKGDMGYWWTSLEGNTYVTAAIQLNFYRSEIYRSGVIKTFPFSVRCIKDIFIQ